MNPGRLQWVVYITCCVRNLLSASVYALPAPFYPREAQDKGMSPTEYGLVFSVYQLASTVASLFAGNLVRSIGVIFTMNISLLIQVVSCTCFGLLTYFSDKTTFMLYSFILRIFEAAGMAGIFVSTNTIVASMFQENCGFFIASLETAYSTGTIIGPAIGGVLFEMGGFVMPFTFIGVILAVVGVISAVATVKAEVQEFKKSPSSCAYAIYSVLEAWVGVLAIFSSSICSGFLQATLEPHVRSFHLGGYLLGVVFLIPGLVNALLSPFFGWLCDRINPKYLVLLGALFKCMALQFIGPFPLSNMNPSFKLIIVGQFFNGLGSAGLNMPTMIDMMQVANRNGFCNKSQVSSMVSSVWQASYSLGAFLGPFLGGVSLQYFSFNSGILILTGILLCFVSFLIFWLLKQCTIRVATKSVYYSNSNEDSPLVNDY